MKKLLNISIVILLGFALLIPMNKTVAAEEVIDEFNGEPIIVLGEQLSDEQKEETRRLLNDKKDVATHEIIVTGQDLHRFIGGNPNANMYSSVKITYKKSGHGLIVNIVTAENITSVTSDMYMNALVTAGVENALVEVASPVKVTGESALTGIYKAYDATNDDLDPERMKVANEELEITTELAERDGVTNEEIASLMAEIKKAIAEMDPVTREEVEEIVEEQLSKLDINLSDEDRQLLVDLFDKMKDLNIDFDQIKDQLNDIASKLKDKLDGIDLDEGFFEKIGNFFKNIFDAIAGLFSSSDD
ncbi:MAG TPA: DUF1002 domain-containing protein [Pseudogracilibacillus sp.]|nr:DUF1002 domain-containing protein [Pseudogracilibacillus sp.]